MNRVALRQFLATATKDSRDRLGRTRDEVQALYSKLVDEYVKSGQQTATLSEIQIWFCDDKVIGAVREMDDMVRKLQEADRTVLTLQNLQQLDSDLESMVRRLSSALGEEIRKRTTCHKA